MKRTILAALVITAPAWGQTAPPPGLQRQIETYAYFGQIDGGCSDQGMTRGIYLIDAFGDEVRPAPDYAKRTLHEWYQAGQERGLAALQRDKAAACTSVTAAMRARLERLARRQLRFTDLGK